MRAHWGDAKSFPRGDLAAATQQVLLLGMGGYLRLERPWFKARPDKAPGKAPEKPMANHR
jgi:hypothetical protein